MQIGTSRYILRLMILGAVSFCLPDTLWHAVRRSDFGQWWADALVLTLVMPLTLLGTYVVVLFHTVYGTEPRKAVGWPMMLGVWLLCGLFVNIDDVVRSASIAELSFSPSDIFSSTIFDGGLPALIIVSIVALIIWPVRASVQARTFH